MAAPRQYGGGKRVPVQKDSRGVSYVVDQNGEKVYIAAANDPNAHEGFWTNKTWNPKTGNYDSSLNKTSLASMATLGAIGGGIGAGVVGGGGGGATATPSLAGTAYAPVSAGVSQGVSTGLGASSMLGGALKGMSLLDYIMAGMGIKDMFGGGGGGAGGAGRTGTFEGESSGGVSLDPRDLLARGISANEGVQGDLAARAHKPVQLRSSYVQQPPTFTGGGLPMPIGVSGYDPALANPSLQTGEGLGGETASEEALAAIDLLKGSQWKPGGGR